MSARSFGIPLATLALATGTACIPGTGSSGNDPIEGEWLGNEANFGNGYTYAFPYSFTNSEGTITDLDLSMNISGTGLGTLNFYSDVTYAGQATSTNTYVYNVDALQLANRAYDITISNSNSSFDLSCDLIDDDDELDCSGTNQDGDAVLFNFFRGATY